MPIHIRDMTALCTQHPEVAAEFHRGHFTDKKTTRNFSIAKDQAHEQHNVHVKGDRGAVGLSNNRLHSDIG